MAHIRQEDYKNHFVHFGDGSTSQFIRIKTEVDTGGRAVRKFILKPGSDIIFKYRLKKDEDLDNLGLCLRRYPESVIVPLDEDPAHTRLLIMTDFNNMPTQLSSRSEKYHQQIQFLEGQLNIFKAMVARLQEDQKLMTGSVHEWMKTSVAIINEARKASAQQKVEEDMDEDDE